MRGHSSVPWKNMKPVVLILLPALTVAVLPRIFDPVENLVKIHVGSYTEVHLYRGWHYAGNVIEQLQASTIYQCVRKCMDSRRDCVAVNFASLDSQTVKRGRPNSCQLIGLMGHEGHRYDGSLLELNGIYDHGQIARRIYDDPVRMTMPSDVDSRPVATAYGIQKCQQYLRSGTKEVEVEYYLYGGMYYNYNQAVIRGLQAHTLGYCIEQCLLDRPGPNLQHCRAVDYRPAEIGRRNCVTMSKSVANDNVNSTHIVPSEEYNHYYVPSI